MSSLVFFSLFFFEFVTKKRKLQFLLRCEFTCTASLQPSHLTCMCSIVNTLLFSVRLLLIVHMTIAHFSQAHPTTCFHLSTASLELMHVVVVYIGVHRLTTYYKS